MLNYHENRQYYRTQRSMAPNWPILLYIGAIVVLTVLCVMVMVGCVYADDTVEGYTTDQWADSIRHAEGNSNYGILAHYKHTTYRQACINTVIHKHRTWVAEGRRGKFVHYLAGKYAPVGSDTDVGTNRYWEGNVQYWLKKG